MYMALLQIGRRGLILRGLIRVVGGVSWASHIVSQSKAVLKGQDTFVYLTVRPFSTALGVMASQRQSLTHTPLNVAEKFQIAFFLLISPDGSAP